MYRTNPTWLWLLWMGLILIACQPKSTSPRIDQSLSLELDLAKRLSRASPDQAYTKIDSLLTQTSKPLDSLAILRVLGEYHFSRGNMPLADSIHSLANHIGVKNQIGGHEFLMNRIAHCRVYQFSKQSDYAIQVMDSLLPIAQAQKDSLLLWHLSQNFVQYHGNRSYTQAKGDKQQAESNPSRPWIDRAVAIATALNDSSLMSGSYYLYSSYFIYRQQCDSVIWAHEQMRNKAPRAVGANEGRILLNELNCEAYLQSIGAKEPDPNPDATLNQYRKAAQYFQQVDTRAILSHTYRNIGVLHYFGKRLDSAYHYLDKAKQLALDNGLMLYAAGFAQTIASVAEEEKDYEKAFTAYHEHAQLAERYNQRNHKAQIERMQAEYAAVELDQQLQRNRFFNTGLSIGLAVLGLLAFLLYRLWQYRKKTSQELSAVNQKLTDLNHTKDRLFSVISHDLKSPLSALRNISQSLSAQLDQLEKEQIQPFLQTMVNASQSTYNLLQNLLQWAISQTEEISFQPQEIDLQVLAFRNAALLEANAVQKQIQIKQDIPENTFVYADKRMIETVVHNLLDNAIKFTPHGGSVRLEAKKQKEMVELSITDSGIGMSPAQIDKLFRLDRDASQIGDHPEKGTGLGLILCRELIQRNQGQIRVESRLGKGSSFRVLLPAPLA